ncbi:MAG: 30S ribosomal protein S9 [Minisyncoccia bacterium]
MEAIGRRKTAIARVRLFKGKGEILVNDKKFTEYFPVKFYQEIVLSPLKLLKLFDKVKISAILKGGGISAQAEALRLGISRALVKLNQEYRKRLKSFGFLTRDPRVKERKKPGLKRARKAPQWSKR